MTVEIKLTYSRNGIEKQREKTFTGPTWQDARKSEENWMGAVGMYTISERRIIDSEQIKK